MLNLKRGIKIKLGGILSVLILAIQVPMLYYYFKLPSNEQVTAGAGLRELFVGFYRVSNSKVGEQDISDRLVCMNCFPEKIGSDGCKAQMASFIAKRLLRPQKMIFWHLKNQYLSQAILYKLDSHAITKLYFAHVAGIFQSQDIDSLCQREFQKACSDLQKNELVSLQGGISLGKFLREFIPSNGSLEGCL